MFRVLLLGLVLGAPLARASDETVLWDIGKADNNTAEFALAPSGYTQFNRDGLFIVGQSDPKRDWPYCHPGPADTWAGGRAHTFTIFFGLQNKPTGPCALRVDLVDTHSSRPPLLRFDVNGRRFDHPCPPGGGDASITGNPKAGKEHRFTIDLPSNTLKAGLNEIKIINTGLSWVLYDWIGFEAPPTTKLAPAQGALVQSVALTPWLSRHDGAVSQELAIDFIALGNGQRLELDATGAPTATITPAAGENSVTLRLRPAANPTPIEIKLRSGGQVLDRREVVQRPARERKPVDYVDCLLGTGSSRWMLYPGPCLPFGMVKLSPDNQKQGWMAGYEYSIENITGFSHIHSWTMGGLLTMPATGELKTVPGTEQDPDAGYRSRFRHETEIAVPGYYAVTLDDYKIRAELTSTTRAGFQRYTFPQASQARILVDLENETEYGYDVLDAKLTKVSDTEIAGYSKQRGRRNAEWNEYTVHFVARADKPFKSMGGWVGTNILQNANEISGKGDVGCFLNYSTSDGDVIQLKTGISLVSIEQARLNLETETAPFGWDFDACRNQARKTWSDLFSAIEVEGGSETDKMKFFSNLYRAYCARTIWSDVNGKYTDMCEKIQQLPDPNSPVYGCDAFWNTFWNLNQLWVLAHPEVAGKWVRSLLEIYDKGGWLPKGPTGIEYSSIMVASHEIALIVAAYQAGIRDFDVAKAWEAIRKIQTTPGRSHPCGGHVGNSQLAPYMELGFVPVEAGPVSNTLEYSYDDWCAAQLAKALDKQDDYHYFLNRSQNYKNVFDPAVGYVRQKHRDGRWVVNFSPFDGHGYVEGNAWQYTWFVPHDLAGLIKLMGGRDRFNDRLNDGFEKARPLFTSRYVDHGNQPNMQAAYLFNYSGAPWLTQKWAREIMDHYYGTGPIDGYPGDEDQGQMGAWYVMSAMGLFQMDGGCAVRPIYEIGSPLFDRIIIHLDPKYYQGGQFMIEAHHNSKTNVYVQSATLNGHPLNQPWFPQAELVNGGKLVLEMGAEPNKAWGSLPNAAPPSIPR